MTLDALIAELQRICSLYHAGPVEVAVETDIGGHRRFVPPTRVATVVVTKDKVETNPGTFLDYFKPTTKSDAGKEQVIIVIH